MEVNVIEFRFASKFSIEFQVVTLLELTFIEKLNQRHWPVGKLNLPVVLRIVGKHADDEIN